MNKSTILKSVTRFGNGSIDDHSSYDSFLTNAIDHFLKWFCSFCPSETSCKQDLEILG